MKKIFISLTVVLVLVAVMAVPVMAAEETPLTATVTVNEYVSVTLTDHGAAGLQYGTLNPGQEKQAEASSPAITLTAASENNRDAEVFLKGTDFSDGGINNFPVSNAYYHDSNTPASALAMPDIYAGSAWKTIGPGSSLGIYHWLSIPDGQAAASYSSTFTYKTQ